MDNSSISNFKHSGYFDKIGYILDTNLQLVWIKIGLFWQNCYKK